MSKLFWNALNSIPMLLAATLLLANCSTAKSQTTIKPIEELTSVVALSKMQPAALNTADKLTPNANVLQINPQPILPQETEGTATVRVAQQPEPEPERKERSNQNYIGIGGSIGLSGDETALGSGGLAILSKNRFTENLSLHSTNIIFGSRTAVSTYALTFGIPVKNQLSGRVIAFPFVGGGLLMTGDFNIDGLVAGGVDVPISENLIGTAQVNVGFPDGETDVGLQIGLGYNFRLF